MTTIDGWLRLHNACNPAKQWVATQLDLDQSLAALVAACPRGDWLLRLAEKLGCYPAHTLTAAARGALLRAVREYVPAALDHAGLHEHATKLRNLPDRNLPDDVTPKAATLWEAEWAARAAQGLLWAAQAEAATQSAARAVAQASICEAAMSAWWAAQCARDAGLDPTTERLRCAAEVRAALPDLTERWAEKLLVVGEKCG